jgi:putative membrane protein
MLRLVARTILVLLANSIGLLVAAIILPGVVISPLGFIVSVIFFTAIEALLEPFILKIAIKYVPALRGGIALITTFVGLLITSWLTAGISITGLTNWVLAPLIIWVTVVIATIVLPLFMFKQLLGNVKPADSKN